MIKSPSRPGYLIRLSVWGVLALSACQTWQKASAPTTPSLTSPEAIQPFAVYTHRGARHNHYIPSGYMGDGNLTMSGAYVPTPDGESGPCLRVNYRPPGPKGWAGIYWQDPTN